MMRLHCAVLLGMLASPKPGAQVETPAHEPSAEFRTIDVHRAGDLTVRLRVRCRASPADRDWMSFEFENRGADPVEFGFFFKIGPVNFHDLATGDPSSELSGMARGGTSDLFPGARWPFSLPTGVTCAFEYPSDYSCALLDMPPPGGWRVRATLWATVAGPGEQLAAPAEPTAEFEFEWVRPDDAGFRRLRETLDERLRHPRPGAVPAYLLRTLLRMPEVGGRVPLSELLDALGSRSGEFLDRHGILHHLDVNFAADDGLVQWVQSRLDSSDDQVVEDLILLRNVWKPSFLPSLLRRYEAGDGLARWSVLWLLERHGAPHRMDQDATRRLSKPLLAKLAAESPARLQRLPEAVRSQVRSGIANTISNLGMTRDRTLLPVLSTWLDCREKLFVVRPIGMSFPYRVNQRICDVALEALLRILDEDPERVYAAAAEQPPGALAFPSLQVLAATRDRMIEQLKARLARQK